jgi:hypothetical protein
MKIEKNFLKSDFFWISVVSFFFYCIFHFTFIYFWSIESGRIIAVVFGFFSLSFLGFAITELYKKISQEDFIKSLKQEKEQCSKELSQIRDLKLKLPKDSYFSKNEIELLEKELRLVKEFWFLENKIK